MKVGRPFPLFLKTILSAALCLALVFMLVACATAPELEVDYELDPAYEETIATEVSTLPLIRVAALESDDLLPLKVAQEEGLLELRGLNVEVLNFETADEKHNAFTRGAADALISDMVDLALLTEEGLTVYAVAVTQDSTNTANTLHSTHFEIPEDLITQRVLAFNQDFLLGNTASGEDTAPEAAAEAVSTLIAALGQAVGQINAAAHAYLDLYLEQGVIAH
ncbi:MAG: ABC transporter substrate-binding protein, partial [Coriobacteriia bacterium]|nr:ABC transporter substrate-binding protein [Coriobacteriia bacterium]